MNDSLPVAQKERLEIIDILRGFAVGGILIGNIQWFSGYGMMPAELAAQAPLIDRVTHFLVHFFIEGKFYSIFSFLFGFGFALQIARAEARGDANASIFKRRLFWLLVIGLLHAYLLWAGDILSIYAVMGFLLILFRKKTDPGLLKWAFALMAVPILWYTLLYILFINFAPPDIADKVRQMQTEGWSRNVAMVSQGNYWQIISGYNLNYIFGRYMGLIIDMRLPKILAMFLLGFYAYRRGFFQNLPEHGPFIRRVLIWGLILGVTGSAAFSALAGKEAAFPPSLAGVGGVITYAFGVPALALAYIALVVTLWQKEGWKKLLAFLAPAGRMALTNYLMQTIACVLIFYGYGFGLFGKFGAVTATLIAFAIFFAQVVFSYIWLKFFLYGPMEWVWRRLTYRQKLPFRRAGN